MVCLILSGKEHVNYSFESNLWARELWKQLKPNYKKKLLFPVYTRHISKTFQMPILESDRNILLLHTFVYPVNETKVILINITSSPYGTVARSSDYRSDDRSHNLFLVSQHTVRTQLSLVFTSSSVWREWDLGCTYGTTDPGTINTRHVTYRSFKCYNTYGSEWEPTLRHLRSSPV